MAFFIGPHQFIELVKLPVTPGEQVEVIQRLGVIGTGLRRIGRRAEPFEVISRVDAASIRDGHNAFFNYALMRGKNPVTIIWDDIDLINHDTLFGVLNVRLVRLKAISTAVGGLHPPSTAWLECLWTMVAMNPF